MASMLQVDLELFSGMYKEVGHFHSVRSLIIGAVW
jgi:hypothetical protein